MAEFSVIDPDEDFIVCLDDYARIGTEVPEERYSWNKQVFCGSISSIRSPILAPAASDDAVTQILPRFREHTHKPSVTNSSELSSWYALSRTSARNAMGRHDSASSGVSAAVIMKEFSSIGFDYNAILGTEGDDEFYQEYVRMSHHIFVHFQEANLESAYQEDYLRKRRQVAASRCSFAAALCLVLFVSNCIGPDDNVASFRRVTWSAVTVGLLAVVLLFCCSGSLTDYFNDWFYDPLICGTSLLAIFLCSMTSDRMARHLDLPDQTWSLVPMQETASGMGLCFIFTFMMIWLNLRLHWMLLTNVVGIPMSIGLMLTYGSLSFDLELAASNYHYDVDGNSSTHQLWVYEQAVIVLALIFSIMAISTYVIARLHEVNSRYVFAKNYFLCQRLERHLRSHEAQLKVNAKRLHSLRPTTIGMSGNEFSEYQKNAMAAEISKRIDLPLIPETLVADREVLFAPTPNTTFSNDLAKYMCDPTHLHNITDRIRDPSYSLQVFYADCQKCFPELLLCRGHELSFQQTVGTFFNVYWLLRLDLEGREGFCFGVDMDWNPNPKPPGKVNINSNFGSLNEGQKRLQFFYDMEWATVDGLISKAGCGYESIDAAERISSLLSLVAIYNLMQNADYHPNVAPEHSPYHGYGSGSTIENNALALQYYLEYFPHLLPSFNRLSPTSQQALRLSLSPKWRHFDLLAAASGEYPPGAKFSSLKSLMYAGIRDVDMAMHIVSWFVRLAAFNGNPFRGAENMIMNIAHSSVSATLQMAPHIFKLPDHSETEVDEYYLKTHCKLLGLPDILQEDGSIAALMRIAIMARSDSSEFIEVFNVLPEEIRHYIIEELSYTGVAGQFYTGMATNIGGPAFILEGFSLFVHRYSGRKDDVLTIFLVLEKLLRAARSAWPLEEDLQGTCVTLRLSALAQQDFMGSHSSRTTKSSAGGELIQLLQPKNAELWTLIGGKGTTLGLLELIRPARLNELQSDATHFQILDLTEIQSRAESLRPTMHPRPNLNGKWKCIETFGMDEFLKAMGVSWVQRTAATKAPWPTWIFKQGDDQIAFINQSALGDLREDILVDGSEYVVVDGWKREIRCKAFWEGNSMIILKSGPEGEFREIRTVEQDELLFKIQNARVDTFPEWGRRFKRIS